MWVGRCFFCYPCEGLLVGVVANLDDLSINLLNQFIDLGEAVLHHVGASLILVRHILK